MSVQTFSRNVTLKVLYTFDEQTTFLARSPKPISAKIIELPAENSPVYGSGSNTVGCIDLRKCVSLVLSMSPERFSKGMDYSVYSKDALEPGEPFVGYGLWTKLKDRRSPVVITGHVCKNFVSLYSGSAASDTLEVKLRLCMVEGATSSAGSATRSRKRKSSARHTGSSNNNSSSPAAPASSTAPGSDDSEFQQPANGMPPSKRSRLLNNMNKPQLATRTQSLPFISENSLAHRIMVSDMKNGPQPTSPSQQLDSRGERISSRFSQFSKLMNANSPPRRARRTQSFMQSVVKIGDSEVHSKASTKSKSRDPIVQKCVNCGATNEPPYRFHREGLYENANAGLLCHICHELERDGKADKLRERGELGSSGLLDGPYSKEKPARKRRSRKSALASSSPSTMYSSPILQDAPTGRTMWCATDTEDIPGRSADQSQQLLTEMDPVYKPTTTSTAPLPLAPSLAKVAGRRRSRKPRAPLVPLSTTPEDETEIEEEEEEAAPIDAARMNTTVIQLEDSDKENAPPTVQQLQLLNKEDCEPTTSTFLGAEISPGLQKIFDSFTENPNAAVTDSPTKNLSPRTWGSNFIDFFQADGELAQNSALDIALVEADTGVDAEVDRVLGKTPPETTPVDPASTVPATVATNADTVNTSHSDSEGTPNSMFDRLLEAAKQPGKPVNNDDTVIPSSPYLNQDTSKLGSEGIWDENSSPITETETSTTLAKKD